jgi:hypothetical protein
MVTVGVLFFEYVVRRDFTPWLEEPANEDGFPMTSQRVTMEGGTNIDKNMPTCQCLP